MSWSWYVYTTHAPSDVVALEGALEDALVPYLEDHDVEDEYAEPGAGGPPPPKAEDVVAYRARFREVVAADLLARLPLCRATFEFEYVRAQPEESPLQVSILRFVLERLAPCIMDWGDLSLETGESALSRLARMRSRGRLGPAPPPKPRPIRRRSQKPGEVRAVRILERLEAAAGDPDAAVDLRAAIAKMSAHAKAYVALLVEEGAMPDAAAKKKLDLDAETLALAIDEVETSLSS